jgi:hypothetical protein
VVLNPDFLFGFPEHPVKDEIQRLKPDDLSLAPQQTYHDGADVDILDGLSKRLAPDALEQNLCGIRLAAGAWMLSFGERCYPTPGGNGGDPQSS